jgi:hypothetical protein
VDSKNCVSGGNVWLHYKRNMCMPKKPKLRELDSIPFSIHIFRKMLKARAFYRKKLEQSMEVLVCPLNHPSLIK